MIEKVIGSAIGGANSKPQTNKASGGLGSVYVDGMVVGEYESEDAKLARYATYALVAGFLFSYFKNK